MKNSCGKEIISKGKLYLGKCDARGTGKKRNEAYITWELTETEKGPEFSAQAEVWNSTGSDIIMGGQCVDDVAAMFPGNAKAQRICEVWKRWHLNGMKAGCEHQRAEHWGDEELDIITYKLNSEGYRLRKEALEEASKAARERRIANLTPAGIILIGDDWYKSLYSAPDADSPLSGLYDVAKCEKKRSGWVRQEEHPKGVLCKPCPVCGYEYGSSWLHESIPADIIAEIKTW